MRSRSATAREHMREQVREVKVLIFSAKARNPFAGNPRWLERWSDLRPCKEGKREIWRRRASRSPWKWVRSREVRLGKRWKRRGRKGVVRSWTAREDRMRLVMERNCLQTRERDSKCCCWFRNRNTI